MTPAKLDILIAQFSYGGNGGFQSEHPDVGRYLAKLALAAKDDERIGRFDQVELADTPITMCRNRAVVTAIREGYDAILMIDSDMSPDCEVGHDYTAKPFWPTAFDYLYERHPFGPVCIGAPYCGPPPINNCYVFHWTNDANADQSANFNAKIDAYTRYQAEQMSGIEEVAALPTGLILFDTRLFTEVCPPKKGKGWFYYEWTDNEASEKASTEDVTATRDISFHGQLKLGYNPLMCAWDSWAAHVKPMHVRKPRSLKMEVINEEFREAVKRNQSSGDVLIRKSFLGNGRAHAHAQ
jgi:hypothetical protein